MTISGVGGNGASRWNGTFEIYDASGSQFKYYMTADPGAAAVITTASKAAKVLAFPFDEVMNAIPTGSRINLGPSPPGQPFLTRGYADGVSGGFQPKAGMYISGSGIDVTTIQLVPKASANAHFFAIAHALTTGTPSVANPMDGVEISSLTIDANFTPPNVAAACGAIRLMGNRTRITNVKAVNWGNRITNKFSFVLAVVTADPATGLSVTDTGIENCIAVNPATSTTHEVLILHAGGKDHDALAELEGYGTSGFIRNCFVDCDSSGVLGTGSDYRSKLRGLSMNSCKIGVIEGNELHNTWYGGPHLTKWSGREITVRSNTYRNVVGGPYMALPGPGTEITNSAMTLPDPSPSPLVEVTTASDHKLASGDRVKIYDASPAAYNGVYIVRSVSALNKFRYELPARPGANTAAGKMKKVLGVENLLIERNSIQLAPFKSPSVRPIAIHLSADTAAALGLDYVYGNIIIRENNIRYLDDQFDAGFLGVPLSVAGARNLLVRNNVIVSAPTDEPPLQNSLCGSVSYFNNETPSGVLVHGVNADLDDKVYNELEAEAEDALVLALM